MRYEQDHALARFGGGDQAAHVVEKRVVELEQALMVGFRNREEVVGLNAGTLRLVLIVRGQEFE